jgi:large subunit ribosomal protein L3
LTIRRAQAWRPISVTIFAVGQKVDVTGQTIGKGFPVASSGTTSARRARRTATRFRTRRSGRPVWRRIRVGCFPGKKMAGHLGAVKRTQQNLEVVRVDVDRQLLLLKGAVPGSKGSDVIVRPAVKAGA